MTDNVAQYRNKLVFCGYPGQDRSIHFMSFAHPRRITDLLYDDYCFFKAGLSNKHSEVMRDRNDINTATSRFAVCYQDIDFVVSHEFLSKDAYRLHSYCYDMKYHIGITYEQIKEDPYRDVHDFDFYCRTEQSTTEICFNEAWLQEWDTKRFERVQKLIAKMPGAYNQYFRPSDN